MCVCLLPLVAAAIAQQPAATSPTPSQRRGRLLIPAGTQTPNTSPAARPTPTPVQRATPVEEPTAIPLSTARPKGGSYKPPQPGKSADDKFNLLDTEAAPPALPSPVAATTPSVTPAPKTFEQPAPTAIPSPALTDKARIQTQRGANFASPSAKPRKSEHKLSRPSQTASPARTPRPTKSSDWRIRRGWQRKTVSPSPGTYISHPPF